MPYFEDWWVQMFFWTGIIFFIMTAWTATYLLIAYWRMRRGRDDATDKADKDSVGKIGRAIQDSLETK